MSAVVATYRDDLEATYAVDFSRDRETMKSRKRFPEYRRTGGAPTRVGGLHCRRNKRWTWGSGRGARALNVRAFASCIAVAAATLAAPAFAAPLNIQWQTVGNVGNTGKSVPIQPGATPRPNTGSVATEFKIGRYETTNAQYAAFLNAVDPTAANPNAIYNSQMNSDAVNGGIIRNIGSGYTVKSGFENKPVNYVNWFSAARFVNWLAGGEQVGSPGQTSMEGGFAGSAYTLPANRTSGNIVPRNPGATVFLPSLDEFYKAAYYTGSGSTYWTYGTQSNSAPTASVNVTDKALANVANYGAVQSVTSGVVAVDWYTSAASYYGLFGAYGNVVEMTDTPSGTDPTMFAAGGSSWRLSTANALNWSGAQIRFLSGGTVSDSHGFRIAAVPEPGTFVLAGLGLGGLALCQGRRRRTKR